MKEHFLTYEQSLAVKELGFDELCMRLKNDIVDVYEEKSWCNWNGAKNLVSIPLKSQFFKWVRQKYKLLASVQYFTGGYYCYTINDMQETKVSNRLFTEFETYEQAEDSCINKIIELLKLK